VRETLTKHKRILFSGDNYSAEWVQEAERRGLANAKDTPTALAAFTAKKNIDLFEKYHVFSPRETDSRATVQFQMYAHRVQVEAGSMRDIASTMIVPAVIAYQRAVAESIAAVAAVEPKADLRTQRELLGRLSEGIGRLRTAIGELEHARHAAEEQKGGPADVARAFRDKVLPAMGTLREIADGLEPLVDDALWPLPKYREILFLH
jgi:glutamine synthetase